MPDTTLLQLGVGLTAALLVIREVLNFLKWKNNGSHGLAYREKEKKELMQNQIQDLYDWHNVTDDDGVKIWYVRRSLEGAVEKLVNAVNEQNKALNELATTNKALLDIIKAIKED